MKHFISNVFSHAMYYFEVELLINERLGKDLGALLLSFVKEDPKPHIWSIMVLPSPWDTLTEVDPNDGVELPLFAP
jgi:hypothetical protein